MCFVWLQGNQGSLKIPPLSKISVEGSQNMPYLYGFGGFTLIILDILSINLSNMIDGLEFVVL